MRDRTLRRSIYVNKRRVPLIVSPDAALKYLKLGAGVFDADLIMLAESFVRPGIVVWDIGANVGVFSFAAAAMGGTVISVEADIWLAQNLRKSAHIPKNSDLEIAVVPVAVSSDIGITTFGVAARGRASNALTSVGGRSQSGGVRELQYVPTVSLDLLLVHFPPPKFVKIDIEGAELLAIQGASVLLRDHRPLMYVEIGPKVATQVTALMENASYLMFDGQSRQRISKCCYNTLFVPNELGTPDGFHDIA